jgi:hypothetical protein
MENDYLKDRERDNFKIYIKEIRCEDRKCMELSQARIPWWTAFRGAEISGSSTGWSY